MGKTVSQGLLAMPQACAGEQQVVIELHEILATEILHLATFEQIPNHFLRVELRCIGRQAFQVNACSSTSSQEVFHGLTAMDAGTIPDDEQLASDLTQELLEKAHHVVSLVRVVLRLHEQSSLRCQRSDSRDVVVSQWHTQDWSLTPWSIGAHGHRPQIKTRLI
jgi:hypothetical protein